MSYPHPVHQIREILAASKCLPPGETLDVHKHGEAREFDTRPQLAGRFVDMRYLGQTHAYDDPGTYHAVFLLANQRVRGVDYEPVGQNNFRYKKRIPKGWHQNVRDPNLPTTDDEENIHQPMENFVPSDFVDFIQKTAKLWNIDLGEQWTGGLFS
ncbi:MAG: hypothetical protein WCS65_14425 [Verrucomicrobiae bacterium]